MSLLPSIRQAVASSSRCRPTRLFSTTLARRDVMTEIDKQLNSREIIEKKRQAFEAKYGDKLKKRVETCVAER